MDYHIHGQFILISFICTIVSIILLLKNVYSINTLTRGLEKNIEEKQDLIDKITKLCVATPIKLYIAQILIPLIITPIILLSIGAETIVVFKISLVFILFLSLSATITYVFSQSEFKKIIIDLYEAYPENINKIKEFNPKLKIKAKILLELMPLIIVSLLFTSLLAYTINSRDTGDIYYKVYNEQLRNIFDESKKYSLEEIISKLNQFSKDDYELEKFIIKEDGTYITINNSKLSEFFIKYSLNNQEKNRTYDYYCIDREGTYIKINDNNGNKYLVGVMYSTNSADFLIALSISFAVLLFLIFITLIYIATSLSKDIELITRGLKTIINKKDLKHKLIPTANDETRRINRSF